MKRAVFFGVLAASAAGLLVACGARTGLLVPEQEVADTGPDVHKKKDVGPDVEEEPDVQGLDVAMLDAYRNDCPDADSTLVYVVSETYELLSFYPPDATFTLIGKLTCPATPSTATPFSMAVDRKGTAYVVYNNGQLFKVSTADASCKATSFVSGQMGFTTTFGMGFATIGAGPAEQLFVAADPTGGATLATIDTTTFALSTIGMVTPPAYLPELTGTGDGRLYGFYAPDSTSMTMAVGEFDKSNGNILGADALSSVDRGTAWAFAFWGGDFWLFTAPGTTPLQTTTKYDPVSKSLSVVAHYSSLIVGAGVSTCAPQ
jgi:hypothetical protein